METIAAPITNLKPKPHEVVLISTDGEGFIVRRDLIKEYSGFLVFLLEDLPNAQEYPLHNVNSTVLAKILEYINRHGAIEVKDGKETPKYTEEELNAWDQEYVKVDQGMLFEIILGANYLDSKKLLDLTCLTVANMIKGKTPEEMRKTFNIENDFTPEEEAAVHRENQWAFE